jgi:hypothetical protein
MKAATTKSAVSASGHNVNDKIVKILASSIYRQLQDEGCAPRDIISVSSQLIDLVTTELQKDVHEPV